MVRVFRNKPVIVTGVKWTGENIGEIAEFVGEPTDVMKFAGADLQIYNTAEVQWISVPKGHWLMKGVKGEFYPIDEVILQQTKEDISDEEEPTAVEV